MLESESVNVSNSNTSQPKSQFKLIMIIAAVAVVAIIGALVVSAIMIPSSSPQGEDGWLFEGAYATYEGSTSVSLEDLGVPDMSFTMDFAVRQEIADFNDTHALVCTSFEMSSTVGGYGGDTEKNTESDWVPLSEMGMMTSFDVDMTNSYESTVNIAGLGTRACMVYEYNISDEGLEMTVYVDKTIKWPLKLTMSMTNTEFSDQTLEFEMNLSETNIAALK